MANRRCFSKDIVASDEFIDMPLSSQALYFQLGMQADDRGYINNAKSITMLIGATNNDLRTLIRKKFVLQRKNGLILIKGWRINNTIQPSRIVETNYTEDLKELYFDENNSYTLTPTDAPCLGGEKALLTKCRQNDDNLPTQYNISKDNIIKDNLRKENILKEKEVSVDTEKPIENISIKGWTQEKVSQVLKLKTLKEECNVKLTEEEEELLKDFERKIKK